MAKIPAEIAKRIDGYVTKYMGILEVAGVPPKFKIYNNPNAFWDGRTSSFAAIDKETGSVDLGSTLDLQKSILKNDRHLERVIAHEMIHHRDWLVQGAKEIAKIQAAAATGAAGEYSVVTGDSEESVDSSEPTAAEDEADKKAHGSSFWEGAARINAVMGPDFVTERAEEVPQRPAREGQSKLVLALGFGGLAVLTGVLLARKLRPDVQKSPAMPMPPPWPALAPRENERGNYGKR